MSKYIDAEKFYKKVDELMEHYARVEKDVKNDVGLSIFYQGRRKMCSEIIGLITSLQWEQTEVDLDKEIEEQFDIVSDGAEHVPVANLLRPTFTRIARHFYELGLSTRKEEK